MHASPKIWKYKKYCFVLNIFLVSQSYKLDFIVPAKASSLNIIIYLQLSYPIDWKITFHNLGIDILLTFQERFLQFFVIVILQLWLSTEVALEGSAWSQFETLRKLENFHPLSPCSNILQSSPNKHEFLKLDYFRKSRS